MDLGGSPGGSQMRSRVMPGPGQGGQGERERAGATGCGVLGGERREEQGGGREEESVNTAPKSPRRQGGEMLGNQTEQERVIPKEKGVKSERREMGSGPCGSCLTLLSRLAWQFSHWLDCNFQLDLGL